VFFLSWFLQPTRIQHIIFSVESIDFLRPTEKNKELSHCSKAKNHASKNTLSYVYIIQVIQALCGFQWCLTADLMPGVYNWYYAK